MTSWNSALALLSGAEQPLRDIIIVMRDTGPQSDLLRTTSDLVIR
jgi:hypothetical protein